MTRVFISYSHKDEALRAELDAHLALLMREGALDVWTDHEIPAGGEVHPSISQGLEDADIVLLLISQYFNASEYCSSIEMKRAVERHDAGECVVVPVLLRPCDWQTAPYARFNAIPRDNRPVTQWPSQDAAFAEIVKELRHLLKRRGTVSEASGPATSAIATSAVPQSAGYAATAPARPVMRSSDLSLPRRFTDRDRHDFVEESFAFVQKYFANSLTEMQARNPGFEGRIRAVSGHGFQAFVFDDGKQVAACYIRIGAGFAGKGIGYTDGDRVDENTYNDSLAIHSDDQKLYLAPAMAWPGREDGKKLSQEGAAEYLWGRFIGSVRGNR